ncbi:MULTISPECIES: FKBP-type peptidyl-prolyl cis-trans isomerase [Fervidobacterium]|uniref:Peptidyl-prolyl cis-trans isomerase n=1 Tax=Fervidobacterium nodosum (strain ATCC 35602 / DSM 5306 / Rt17-B1) TaxID=381764 RepID=A7HKR5_FERNB|nr:MULTISPECIES: peptidylprolyl isomerase [Fervidobacterium]ABS60498.1 peptidylprolyl isomerase FKBP-type [Fervidobacterium nodosum Rt17-B1]KAF2962537.1 peptidylprolyl isomerase [Fervidobacterium sp. 2310opik-2]PHJ14451.1 peptidylprolyl isomerase [Fervidobacterium sp. SC_NGM5_G05]
MGIKVGDKVKLHYTGMFEDGQIFDTSLNREPLEFVVGAGQIIPGFEEEILGMEMGDKKRFTVSFEKAYGPVREDLKFSVERGRLPEDVSVGDLLEVHQPDGNFFVVRVEELNDAVAILDANHPLAGKNLIFEIEILEIN